MIKVWYYGLTTLSTIGFGDFSPKSTEEKFIISFAMMLGVTVFSYIMGNLIDILAGYNSLQLKKDTKDLTKWMALLSKFSDGEKLNRTLTNQIEQHFEYYWTNNPLGAFQEECDRKIFGQLPESIITSIYVDYLFKNFLIQFSNFLQIKTWNGREMTVLQYKYRSFLFELLDSLQPRLYRIGEEHV